MTAYVLLVALAFGLIIRAQVPPLIKKKQWRELAAFGVLFGIGTAISILQIIDVKLPNPADFIWKIFEPLVEWIEQTEP